MPGSNRGLQEGEASERGGEIHTSLSVVDSSMRVVEKAFLSALEPD